MKLEELFEKLGAYVHVNNEETLAVIAKLVEKEFGPEFKKISLGCLVAQVVYSMSAIANIKPKDLINAINKSDLRGEFGGVSLENIFKIFEKPINVGNKTLKFHLSVETPKIEDVVKEVKSGQPVIFIPSVVLQSYMDTSDSGIVVLPNKDYGNVKDQSVWHAFLIIGYDKDGYLIIRDMRSVYLYKGYAKVPIKPLKKIPNAYRLISVIVDRVEEL
jgi:hypothetical protein